MNIGNQPPQIQINQLPQQRVRLINQVSPCKKVMQICFFIFCFLMIITQNQLQVHMWIWTAWYLTIGVRRYDKQGLMPLFAELINLVLWFITLFEYFQLSGVKDKQKIVVIDALFIIVNLDYFCTSCSLMCSIIIIFCLFGTILVRYLKNLRNQSSRKNRRDQFMKELLSNTQRVQPRTGQQNTCSICLLDDPRMKLPCTHPYHEQCIKLWLEDHDTCPICRVNVY